ncbi:MAG: DEAD/DEAH box helicase family protein [Desulfuromonadales bacterium]
MILRTYQRRVIDKAKKALKQKGNTMVQAATGAGKTIMLAMLAREVKGKTLILQHRQELVQQNAAKFQRINPEWSLSFFTSDQKSFGGQATFSMQQTLCRNLDHLPKFDHVIVDEVHHIIAPTYSRIIDACRERNPGMLLSGFTATPERGDKKSLRAYFDNVAGQVTIRELVSLGFLVPPRAFVVNVGTQERLGQIKSLSAFGDQTEVAKVMDTPVINVEVVRHWRDKAGDRKTIVFCATVQHALSVADTFKSDGVTVGVVTGDMADGERKAVLIKFDRGNTQVLVNVAVLTEGYDSQPVSCIVLLRQCSEKGPMIQMAGRGLRTVDPELYPNVTKKDCIILDFGTSLLTHGNLDQADGLHQDMEAGEGEAKVKICPEDGEDKFGLTGCGAEIPANSRTCPLCGYSFAKEDTDQEQLTEVNLTEMDILNASPFRWEDLFGTDTCLMACGFSAWGGVFSPDRGETWIALGKRQDEKRVHVLARTARLPAMSAADDFLRNYETAKSATKGKQWLNDPATEKQMDVLNKFGYQTGNGLFGFTKYRAACHANFQFNKYAIERALGVA